MPIVEALRQGAQIVITGRTTDTGLTLAPMIYEFGWSEEDWDKLASGTVAGHILECGAQSSGGNFSADWKRIKDFANIGFPIAEAYPNGEFAGGFLPAFLYDYGIFGALLVMGFIFQKIGFISISSLVVVLMLLNANFNTQLFWFIILCLTLNHHFKREENEALH